MEVGDYAKYVNTGTVGIVHEIREEEGAKWMLLDTTALYYHESTLEPADLSEYEEVSEGEKSLDRNLEDLERMRKSMRDMEDSIGDISPTGT